MVRDWSIITGRVGGGAIKREMGGGASEVLPLQKEGWTKKVLAMLKVGHNKF